MKNKTNINIILIFFAALIVRLIFVFFTPERPTTWDDTLSWDAVGWNLAQGKGFLESDGSPTQARPPVYPIFLAIIYLIFGRNFLPVKIFQCILNSLTIVIIYFTTRKILDSKIAFATSLFLSFYPPQIVYVGIIGSEIMFTFLISLTIFVLVDAINYDLLNKYILSGILLGISNLCRSTTILYPIFLLIGLLIVKIKFYLKKFLYFLILTYLTILPWTIRNYIVFKDFIPVNTGAGGLFWSATYEPWDGQALHGKSPVDVYPELKSLPWHKWEKLVLYYGIKNIFSNPVGYIKLCVKNFLRLWFQPIGQVLVSRKSYSLGLVMYFIHALWIIISVYGIFSIKHLWDKIFVILVMFFYLSVMHTIIAPIARYRYFVEPYIMIFFVQGLFFIKRVVDKNFYFKYSKFNSSTYNLY